MALISNGIERVTVSELPSGIWADGRSNAQPLAALVRWRSSWNDKFYQVYVNGKYAGVTAETTQRQMAVRIPMSPETAVRIEVFAVSAAEADIDFSSELDSSFGHSGRVKIRLLRSQHLPIGSTFSVYFDNGTGQIDYDNPLNDTPIRVWQAWQDKAGFGMSRFGTGDFGFDSAAAAGFGRGSFGNGHFGLDADTIEWVSEPMPAGVYKFAVKVTDRQGSQSNASQTREVTVIPAARPAEQLNVSSFNKNTNQLVLEIADSL